MRELLANPVVAMILMLGSLVLIHELGHYLVGIWCGVAVEKFSIGFGSNIASFRRGQTQFSVGWIPLGGYVKFYGSTRNEQVPRHVQGLLFWNAPVWKRLLIVAAGPVANFLLAFFIFWALVFRGIEYPPPVVGDVIEGGRAQVAGILPGDRIVEIEGEKTETWGDIERLFQRSPERSLSILVNRQDAQVQLAVTPESVTGRTIFGSQAKIGRVGISLGYPSAVVTMTSESSPLYSAGVRTGDKFDSWYSGGAWVKIQGLHDTLRLLRQWRTSGDQEVRLRLRPVRIVDDKKNGAIEDESAPEREVTLKPGQWPGVEDSDTPRTYARKLGVVDSHLTIGLANGNLERTLLPGDRLIEWDHVAVKNIFHLNELMEAWAKPSVMLTIDRDLKTIEIEVPLKAIERQMPEGVVTSHVLDASMLGFMALPEREKKPEPDPLKAAGTAVKEAGKQTYMMAVSLWQIVSGDVPVKALGGPMMIAKVAGDSAKAGAGAFLASMALISINLGLVNLFPIPVLDGGQIILLLAESVKRKPLQESTIENFQKIGFVIVMSLVVLALYNDLSRFWGSIVGSITGSR
jgi:regulator of sigma E protease